MIEAYKNSKGISSIGKGRYPNMGNTRMEVTLPENLKKDLAGFYLKDIPETVIVTDKDFTTFEGWMGFLYFE